MDFVDGLGDTSGALEIAVDDIGRVEIMNGRVRITFAAYRGGAAFAAVALVWSKEAYAAMQPKREIMNGVILGRLSPDAIVTEGAAETAH